MLSGLTFMAQMILESN